VTCSSQKDGGNMEINIITPDDVVAPGGHIGPAVEPAQDLGQNGRTRPDGVRRSSS
jgi:hypothetical protein